MSRIAENFRVYLKNQKASKATVKNYVADVNHFFNWLHQKSNQNINSQNLPRLFTSKNLEDYKSNLLNNITPLSTINRRLSSLRKFGQFAITTNRLKNNPASATQNITHNANENNDPKILIRFQKHLEKEAISPITIKNYLSDIRHFLAWLEIS